MRKEVRYRVGAPAVFVWEGQHHKRFQGEGTTRDISVRGAFIVAATSPPTECSIEVDFLLPSIEGLNGLMRISGTARVVRIDGPFGPRCANGFAVVTEGPLQWCLTTVQDEPDMALVADAHGALKPSMN